MNARPVFQLRIELQEVEPTVWRSIRVPGWITLAKLHQILQIVMGWTDTHLHEFDIRGARYGVPDPDFNDPPVTSEKRVTLTDVLTPAVRAFTYSYDFGDDWQHTVRIETRGTVGPGERPLLCLSGANACPPEDVGGPYGYVEFLAAIHDPQHSEHQEYLQWCGGAFDPAGFDLLAVNKRLRRLKV